VWRSIRVLDDVGAISRPPGVRFDPGGIGKGLAADLVAQQLEGYGRYAIDCCGDVRVGGRDPGAEPVEIEVRDPITGIAADAFTILRGAVATSGIDTRLWLGRNGRHAHHLIDPATGEPAWTGVIGATARGDGARGGHACQGRAAERPRRRSPLPLRNGGLIVCDDGRVERIGPLQDPPRVRISLPDRAARL
jgi:FAD:protein FMN transferase